MNRIKNRCKRNRVSVTLRSSFKITFKVLCCSPPSSLNPFPSIISLRVEKLLLLPSNKPLEIPKETTETIVYLSSWCMCVFVCLCVCVSEDGWVQRVRVVSQTLLRMSDVQVRKCVFVCLFVHLYECVFGLNIWRAPAVAVRMCGGDHASVNWCDCVCVCNHA